MSEQPIRIGVIGLGAVAQMMHLPHLYDMDEFELVALADVSAETLEAVSDYYHIAADARYTDYRELVRRSDLDAVLIASGGTHTSFVTAALDAGKHVFCEKPLCYTEREINEIDTALKRSSKLLMVGYMKRYDPGYCYARERILEMRDLRYARITILHPNNELGLAHHRIRRSKAKVLEGHQPPVMDFAAQIKEQRGVHVRPLEGLIRESIGDVPPIKQLAFGLMVNSLCHDVNALRGILGEPQGVEFTDVWQEGTAIHSILRFESGVHVTLTWVLLPALKDYREELAFFGADARVSITFPSPYFRNMPTPIIIQGAEGELAWEKRVIVNYEEEFKEELRHFHECIVNDKQPLTNLDDSRHDLAVIRQMALAMR